MNFIELAQAAGITLQSSDAAKLQSFVMRHMQHAHMQGYREGAKDEREACAQVAEVAEPYQAADLIRARGQA